MTRRRVPLGSSWWWSLALMLGPGVGLGVGLTAPVALRAQEAPTDSGIVRPAPIVTWGDLKGAAIGTGLSVLAVPLDGRVRSAVRRPEWQVLEGIQELARVGNLWGDPTVLTLSTGMWIGGRLTGHPMVAQVGLRAFETIGVSGVITRVMKATS